MLASSCLRRRRWHTEGRTRKIGEGQDRRPDRSRLSANVIVRRHIIIHHPSLINAKGEVCTQLPPTIHCYNVRTRTRTYARTHAHTESRVRACFTNGESALNSYRVYIRNKKKKKTVIGLETRRLKTHMRRYFAV